MLKINETVALKTLKINTDEDINKKKKNKRSFFVPKIMRIVKEIT